MNKLSTKKIGLIEDDSQFYKNFQFVLKDNNDVLWYKHPNEVSVKELKEKGIDILFVDLHYYGSNEEEGIKFIKKLKTEHIKIPIIAVTNRPWLSKKTEMQDCADDCICKSEINSEIVSLMIDKHCYPKN